MRNSKKSSNSAGSKTVLLSIRPEFARKILNGEKRFEFRRRCFDPDEVESVLVYATLPVGEIVGEFTIRRVISGKPETVWKKTRNSAGIPKSYFSEYFSGRKTAFAIEVHEVTKFDPPLNPREAHARFVAPQSYLFWKGQDV